jgi:hypothetical protein
VLALSRKRPLISAEASFQEIEIAFNRLKRADAKQVSRKIWTTAVTPSKEYALMGKEPT